MTDKEIDDLIDDLLVDIDDLDARHSFRLLLKSRLKEYDPSTLTPSQASDILQAEVEFLLRDDVQQKIQQLKKLH